ncbi:PIN domain-containing protein [Bacillus sp. TD10]|uniref:PIN domain-containing protein n=1 Tax=Bacillus TaxID=1386 RepID=UPI003014C99A
MDTWNVFLDTSIFVGLNYNFKNKRIETLIELVEDELVNLYTTTITKNEGYNNIKKRVDHSRQFINQLKDGGSILRNTPEYEKIWDRKTIIEAQRKLEESFKTFLEGAKVREIPISSKGVINIFNRYFESKPPFSQQKKTEFPDAFVLDSLADWTKENKEKLYVVSSDSDMKNFCEEQDNLIYVDSLEKMLDIIYQTEDVKYHVVQKLYDEYNSEFLGDVNGSIDQLNFDVSDIYGDVEVLDIEALDLSEDPLVIGIQGNTVNIVFNVVISYRASVTFLNESNSVYDKETGEYIFTEYDSKVIEEIDRVPVEFELNFKNFQSQDLDFTIEKLIINKGETIYLSLIEEY